MLISIVGLASNKVRCRGKLSSLLATRWWLLAAEALTVCGLTREALVGIKGVWSCSLTKWAAALKTHGEEMDKSSLHCMVQTRFYNKYTSDWTGGNFGYRSRSFSPSNCYQMPMVGVVFAQEVGLPNVLPKPLTTPGEWQLNSSSSHSRTLWLRFSLLSVRV